MGDKKKFSFKESKVGKFLNTHGKTALGTVLDIADDIFPPLGLITKAADMAGLTPEKKQELEGIYNDESKEFIEMRRRIIKRKEDLKAQHPYIENDDWM